MSIIKDVISQLSKSLREYKVEDKKDKKDLIPLLSKSIKEYEVEKKKNNNLGSSLHKKKIEDENLLEKKISKEVLSDKHNPLEDIASKEEVRWKSIEEKEEHLEKKELLRVNAAYKQHDINPQGNNSESHEQAYSSSHSQEKHHHDYNSGHKPNEAYHSHNHY